jgi:non-specific serine/threonine protein kinase
VVFDEATMELWVRGQRSETEPQPLRVLSMLLRAEEKLVSTAELAHFLTTEYAIAKSISRLRAALQDCGKYVKTVRGKGYRFDAGRVPVERTVSGSVVVNSLQLKPRHPVPERKGLVLERQLGGQLPGTEAWIAYRSASGERRVFKFATDAAGIASLKREVVLSRLVRAELGQRPDILQLHGSSLQSAPFFLEGEDGGQELTAWAAEHLGGMCLEERLELFLQVAGTVRDLHRIGLFVNDIQPGNILVAGESRRWRVRLASFGRCWLPDPGRLDHHQIDTLGLTPAQVMGAQVPAATGPHIAPELRIGGPATPGGDIYALGTLLYQLLAGNVRKNLDSGWHRDVEEVLVHADIAAATDGDPGHRTVRVEALIEGVMSLELRRARREHERVEREAEMNVQRHQIRSSARRPWVLMTLLILAVTSVVGLVQTNQSRVESREEAEQRVLLTKDLPVMANPVAPSSAREAASEESLTTLERIYASATDPTTKARLLGQIADAYWGWGKYDKAEARLSEATKLLEEALGSAHVSTLEAEYLHARTLALLTRFKDADDLLQRTDLLAGDRLRTPTRLAMISLWVHAGVAFVQSQPDRALPLYQQADRVRALVAPDDPAWLFRTQDGLASCYVRLNRNEEAVTLLQRLLSSNRAPDTLDVLEWIKARLQYGVALRNVARIREAERVTQEAVHDSVLAAGARTYITAVAWEHLGAAYQAGGRLKDALEAERSAYGILKDTVGRLGRGTLAVSGNLAALEYLTGNLHQALGDLRSTHTAMVSVLGQTAPLTQLVDYYLAATLNETGSAEEAWSLVTRLEPNALAAADASGFWDERLQGLKGQILVNRGQIQQGRALILESLTTLRHKRVQSWIMEQLQRRMGSTPPSMGKDRTI